MHRGKKRLQREFGDEGCVGRGTDGGRSEAVNAGTDRSKTILFC